MFNRLCYGCSKKKKKKRKETMKDRKRNTGNLRFKISKIRKEEKGKERRREENRKFRGTEEREKRGRRGEGRMDGHKMDTTICY